jgi:hypothetical protein
MLAAVALGAGLLLGDVIRRRRRGPGPSGESRGLIRRRERWRPFVAYWPHPVTGLGTALTRRSTGREAERLVP